MKTPIECAHYNGKGVFPDLQVHIGDRIEFMLYNVKARGRVRETFEKNGKEYVRVGQFHIWVQNIIGPDTGLGLEI